MIVLDFIVTVFQSFFLGHNIKSCLDEKSNIKMAGVIILSILVSSDITKSICGVHSDYLICINNLILMLIVGIFYRKDLKIGKGINVILDENYNKNSIGINDMELYRVVSNIVNNAIKAMDGHGTIVAKAYEVINKVVIEIGNNGPMISNDNINIIFNEGFTTKNNDDKSHGYGLSIAKELVEKYDGRITVKSTEENTVFKICFNTI